MNKNMFVIVNNCHRFSVWYLKYLDEYASDQTFDIDVDRHTLRGHYKISPSWILMTVKRWQGQESNRWIPRG